MTPINIKVLRGLLVGTLLAGTLFAWLKSIPQLTNFYTLYGTFFRMSDTVPNPLLTACLYGSTAFLVALYWSFRVYRNPSATSERYLRNFLVFCVAFAGSVVLSEMAEYYHWFASSISVNCSPGVPPAQTPCFFGMLFFIAALAVSLFIALASTSHEKTPSLS
jgi:hypothetical protein